MRKLLRRIIVFSLLGLFGFNVYADSYVAKINNINYVTLTEAINTAKDNDTIELLSNVNENININKPITLDLGGFELSSNSNKSIISVNNLKGVITIKNGTIKNGNATMGGAINVSNNDNLIIDSVTFDGNMVSSNGGALLISAGNVKINNSKLINNSTTRGSGGAIYINAAGNKESIVTIYNTLIDNNTATLGNGGGIAISSGSKAANLEINEETILSSNKAKNGGALWVSGSNSKLVVNAGTISNNYSSNDGSAIYSTEKQNSLIINAGTIKNNTAVNNGTINIKADTYLKEVKIGSDVVVTNNNAKKGAGVYADSFNSAEGLVLDVLGKIYDNNASVAGDDIYSTGTGKNDITINLNDNISGLKLTKCNHKIDGWYNDSEDLRWLVHTDNQEEIKAYLFNEYDKNSSVAIKAAHTIMSKVIAHYVEQDGNKISDDVILEGFIDDEYKTNAKDITGYILNKVDGLEEGTMTLEDIHITYIYEFIHGTGDIEEPVIKPEEKPTPDIPYTGIEEKNDSTNVILMGCSLSLLTLLVVLRKKFN